MQNGKSGIVKNQTYADMNFRSQISGSIDIDLREVIDRKLLRFMGEAPAYAYLAALDAIDMSGLSDEMLSNPRI